MLFSPPPSSVHANPDDSEDDSDDPDRYRAEFSQTTRGRDQLIFCGQPFVYEKLATLASGEEKKLWRCNQWWNQRCRARVFTIGGTVTPLNKYHTHQDIIKRKKRESRKAPAGKINEEWKTMIKDENVVEK